MSTRSWFSLSALPESILTGGVYLLGEYAVAEVPFSQNGLQRFGESTISSLVASPISEALWSAVLPSAQAQAHPQAIHAVTSGLLFAGADMFFEYSNQSFIYKFLIQAGSEAISETAISTLGFSS